MSDLLEIIAALKSTDSGPSADAFWGMIATFSNEHWTSNKLSTISIERGEAAVKLTISLRGEGGVQGASLIYNLNAGADGTVFKRRFVTGSPEINHRGPVEDQALGRFILKALISTIDETDS